MSANVRRFVLSILVLLFWAMPALANSSDTDEKSGFGAFFDKAVSWFKRQEQAMGNLVSKGWEWFKYTSLGYKAVEKAKRAFVDTVDTLTFNTEAYRTYSDNLYAYGMFQELRDRWHEQRVSETTQHFLLGGLIDSPQRMGGVLVARAGTSPDDPMWGKEYRLWLAVA